MAQGSEWVWGSCGESSCNLRSLPQDCTAMDEHGIAAALLPLVTAFCRVSICCILPPCTALADSELLGGCRGWQAEGLRASAAARLRADCPLGASQSTGPCPVASNRSQGWPGWLRRSLGPRLPRWLAHLREGRSNWGCSEVPA